MYPAEMMKRLEMVLEKDPSLLSDLEMAASFSRMGDELAGEVSQAGMGADELNILNAAVVAGQGVGLERCRTLADKIVKAGDNREEIAEWLMINVDAILKKFRGWLEITNATVLEGFTQPVNGVVFSADGSLLAAVDHSGEVRVWRYAERKLLHTLHADKGAECLAISPDSSRLAAGSGGAIHLWDLESGELLKFGSGIFSRKGILNGHSKNVLSLTFAPDGKRLYSGGYDGQLLVWSLETGKQVGHLGEPDRKQPDAVACLAFSPNGVTLVSGDYAGVLSIWDPVQGKLQNHLDWNIFWVSGVAFFPDSKRLAVATNYVREGLFTEKDALKRMNEGPDVLHLFARRWSGEQMAKNLQEMLGARSRLWELQAANVTRLLGDLDGGIGAGTDVAISPDGTQVALANVNGEISLWDVEKRTLTAKLMGHMAGVRKLAFAPQGGLLASAGWDATVRVWQV